jgi:hypothetical protein
LKQSVHRLYKLQIERSTITVTPKGTILTGVKPTILFNMENKYFSTKQKAAQIEGKKKRRALIKATEEAAQRAVNASVLDQEDKIDTILSGSTGIGKTWNTEKALEGLEFKPNEDYVLLQGNHSMTAFAIKLMMAHRTFTLNKKNEDETLIVMVDDCDTFFSNKDSRNILKGMTGRRGTRRLQYNKILPEHMLTDRQHAVLEHYRHTDGSPGFTISCDDVAFIFTTNFKFPTENQASAELAKNGPTNRANALQDLAALRSRCKTKDFMLDKAINWGWIVEVALNDGLLDMLNETEDPEFSKYRLLDWVLNNWDNMTEHNLRTISDMGRMMIKYPDSYIDEWEADFVEGNTLVLL